MFCMRTDGGTPAVENQATDRAYRIGQTQFVHVHKFVTIGTIEEKIDALLTQKQTMSEQFIQSSQWMTELSDSELKELFTYNL
ncbi:DEAD/DEAH box helicase [Planococcus sp. 107-1]|nr:DEAD/DEAH box helicase [Planococcus sp. 107-1]UJF26246.1 DEAD/DEAH box helicase [Planococcus sp. 107-1]